MSSRTLMCQSLPVPKEFFFLMNSATQMSIRLKRTRRTMFTPSRLHKFQMIWLVKVSPQQTQLQCMMSPSKRIRWSPKAITALLTTFQVIFSGLFLQLLGASFHSLRMLILKHVMPFVLLTLWYAFKTNLLGCFILDRLKPLIMPSFYSSLTSNILRIT